MKAVRMLGIAALIGILFIPLASAEKGDMQQLMQEVKAYNEKAKAYMESKRSEMQAIEAKINDLKSKAGSSAEKQAGKGPMMSPEMQQLMSQKHAIGLDIVDHEVEFAQQHVQFAQRRLQLAQEHQALMKEKMAGGPPAAASSKK